MKKYSIYLFAFLFVYSFLSCNDDTPSPDPISTATYEGSANINPNNFPAGIGLSLTLGDTGKVVQLDAEASFDWDIKVITYRTSQGGRPAVFLFGDVETSNATEAVNVSVSHNIGLGSAGFEAFTTVTTAMQSDLVADGVFNFDPVTDVDGSGKADQTKLEAAYLDLVIGDKIVNLEEAEQPVFLVQSKNGSLFKFQMVQRESGGPTQLRWARFGSTAIQ